MKAGTFRISRIEVRDATGLGDMNATINALTQMLVLYVRKGKGNGKEKEREKERKKKK
jgi:hypothetical protein